MKVIKIWLQMRFSSFLQLFDSIQEHCHANRPQGGGRLTFLTEIERRDKMHLNGIINKRKKSTDQEVTQSDVSTFRLIENENHMIPIMWKIMTINGNY